MAATVQQRQAPSIMDNSPRQIRDALERSDDWADFDILELERLTDKRYVVHTGGREWSGEAPYFTVLRNAQLATLNQPC